MKQLISCFLSISQSQSVCLSHDVRCTLLASSNNNKPRHAINPHRHHHKHRAILNLVPLSEAWDAHNDGQRSSTPFATLLPKLGCRCFDSEGTLLQSTTSDNTPPFRLYLATEFDDLPPIAQLTIDVFDVSAIALSSSSDWNALEQAVIGSVVQPAIGMYNSWAQVVGYTEVLSGLKKRMRNRMTDRGGSSQYDGFDWLAPLVVPDSIDRSDRTLTKTTTYENIAARSSLILALARPVEDTMEVVASIELRLQPTDAKIPFSQPWLDKLERRLVRLIPFVKGSSAPTLITNKAAATNGDSISGVVEGTHHGNNPPLRPYLCNLCVSPSLRSLGIGRALCRIVEAIAHEKWTYSHIYLHVDPTNDAARTLYEKEGYVDVGRRWNVIWAGGANEISYYVKRI